MSKQRTKEELAAALAEEQRANDNLRRMLEEVSIDSERLRGERDRALEILLRQAENANAKPTGDDLLAYANKLLPLLASVMAPPQGA